MPALDGAGRDLALREKFTGPATDQWVIEGLARLKLGWPIPDKGQHIRIAIGCATLPTPAQ